MARPRSEPAAADRQARWRRVRFRRVLALFLLTAFLAMTLSACLAAGSRSGSPRGVAAAEGATVPGGSVASAAAPTAWDGAQPYMFTDALGAPVTLSARPQRVAALMGSFAETWVLAGGELAGVTSDAMTERNLPLPESVVSVGGVKDPNLEQLVALNPDFVILSADIEGHRKIGPQLADIGIPHAFFKVEYFDDYLAMLRTFTEITGRADRFRQNGLDVRDRILALLASRTPASGSPAAEAARRPKVLLIRAFSTGAKALKSANMAGRMLADLGADNIADRRPSLLDDLSIETIIAEDPDYILVVTMGESTGKALDALREGVERNPAWQRLSAVRSNRYIVLPKELYHYKPNARWDEAYANLAGILSS